VSTSPLAVRVTIGQQVTAVTCEPGAQVALGDRLFEVDAAESPA
jgi:hypothetical protein